MSGGMRAHKSGGMSGRLDDGLQRPPQRVLATTLLLFPFGLRLLLACLRQATGTLDDSRDLCRFCLLSCNHWTAALYRSHKLVTVGIMATVGVGVMATVGVVTPIHASWYRMADAAGLLG